jgi:hypothetical protein
MKPSKFVSELFNGIFGKNFFTRKPNLSCEQEQSKESFFRHSLLAPVPSYGQKSQEISQQMFKAIVPASQVIVDGPIVLKKSKEKLRLLKSQPKRKIEGPERKLDSKSLGFGKIDFQTLQIRFTNALFEFWSNPRLRVGLVFVLVIAPLSKFSYLIFPKEGFGLYLVNNEFFSIPNLIEGTHWYFRSLFYFFFSINEFLTPLLTIIGIYFLFPKNYYPSYLCGVPAGYYFALLIKRITVNSDLGFHSPVALSIVLSAILFTVFLFYMSDKMLFKTNHRKRAIEARILGLINMPGMSWKDKEALLKREAKDAMKANNELFNRAG